MKRFETTIQLILTFCALTNLTGGIWFFGGEGTYLALAFAVGTLLWILIWNWNDLRSVTAVLVLLSVSTSALMVLQSLPSQEVDLIAINLVIAIAALVGSGIWFRRKSP